VLNKPTGPNVLVACGKPEDMGRPPLYAVRLEHSGLTGQTVLLIANNQDDVRRTEAELLASGLDAPHSWQPVDLAQLSNLGIPVILHHLGQDTASADPEEQDAAPPP